MSEPVSALKNAVFTDGIAQITELGAKGMISLRGDLSDKALQKAVKAASGTAMPALRECLIAGGNGVAWMSPDELLVICAYEEATATQSALSSALSGSHALVANVSDARAVFEVRGPHAREVIAKLMPVDLAPNQFGTGMIRRSRLGQVAAAFWMVEEGVFHIVCFRSVAQYVFDALSAAAQAGSEVNTAWADQG
ncbi:MAG: sarcosine oxidase subunit gamma family protein [Sulfitobacter sp.]